MKIQNALVQIQKWIDNEKAFNEKLIKDNTISLKKENLEALEIYLNGKINGMEFVKQLIESHLYIKPIKK